MKPLQIIGGVTFGLVCTTIDCWPTWAVLLLPLILGCAIFFHALWREMYPLDDTDDRNESPTDTPIGDYLDRKYGRNEH